MRFLVASPITWQTADCGRLQMRNDNNLPYGPAHLGRQPPRCARQLTQRRGQPAAAAAQARHFTRLLRRMAGWRHVLVALPPLAQRPLVATAERAIARRAV